jgi:hypothetical protein
MDIGREGDSVPKRIKKPKKLVEAEVPMNNFLKFIDNLLEFPYLSYSITFLVVLVRVQGHYNIHKIIF